jgi:hypothetical protein
MHPAKFGRSRVRMEARLRGGENKDEDRFEHLLTQAASSWKSKWSPVSRKKRHNCTETAKLEIDRDR